MASARPRPLLAPVTRTTRSASKPAGGVKFLGIDMVSPKVASARGGCAARGGPGVIQVGQPKIRAGAALPLIQMLCAEGRKHRQMAQRRPLLYGERRSGFGEITSRMLAHSLQIGMEAGR